MTDLGEVGTHTDITPNCGVKIISWYTDATPDAADTLEIDLETYGCTKVHAVFGFSEQTAGSIVILDQPIVTLVTSSVLKVTIPAGTNDDIRNYLVFAY